uniref:Pattern formation protein EMB30 n=1 Tax=Cajanus cajan TaxID=3821 RepID=A0A151TCI6_CAJCA|nr:Pattern formation protein EMB30 [Cajanus cajan]
MGRLKLQAGINAIEEEEPEECDASYPNKTTLACMINSEIGAVLAVMRRNVRWGGRYMSGDDQLEHSLIQSFKTVRRQIFSWHHHQWQAINPALYLQPFLDVIRSDETGAPITGVALSSVYKIMTLDVIDQNTVNVENAMHLVVDAVTNCRFEVTDPSSEEVVLMKILQVLLSCMKSKASIMLSNQHVCTIVNTCFRIVHQAGSKGELLQQIARYTMHEIVRCIFSHLQDVGNTDHALVNGSSNLKQETGGLDNEYAFGSRQLENGSMSSEYDNQSLSTNSAPNAASVVKATVMDENTAITISGKDGVPYDMHLMTEPYGVPCMVEIFHFLCALLNVVEHTGMGPRSNTLAFDEDVPLFALNLINSAIELGGPSICRHPRLLSLIQDELFHNLMQFGLSVSPLILSMVCSIVLNLYHHLRTELKLQLEAFFSCIILRLAQSRYGASYQQQEVAMEALVDFCRQKTFMVDMYANFDCDITCSNVFEDLANLLSKSAFPVNCPLSAMHILALDGLIAVIQGMAERIANGSVSSEYSPVNLEEYTPFWMVKCENYDDPNHWVPFVRRRKYIKRRLMIGADHFNRDPKKGLEFLQGTHLLPDKLDPQSVACFFRYTAGLDKNLVGDFLGNHDEFCVQVLHEFAGTFDFQDMNLDTALRLFLETFRLPGESQKIHRVLEAFSERYYEQSPHILANKDAALVLSYSMIMLNTDQHNVQVKKKMTEEDFIRNNRHINGGNDLPREMLSEIYHSICKNEIRTTPEQGVGFPEMTPSRWIDLMHKSKKTAPFIVSDSKAYLDHDMFAIMSGPTIAAISVVFDHAEQEEVYQTCMDGFLAIAKISACHHLEDVLDDLVVSLCKFTTLLNPSSVEEPVLAFGDDMKARMATVTLARALTWAAGRPQKGNSTPEDEDTAVFCLELLIAITLNNRDRIGILWQGVYEHISSIVQSTVMPCALVEKAVFGLLRICQRLLPYKENIADELLRSLQLVLKLDARVADAYCEQITQEVSRLVKANASHIRSQLGWRTITSLLSITARHIEASEAGFDALLFIMSDSAHLVPANYVFCVDTARQFAESRVGQAERSVRALDLMAGSVNCLAQWTSEAKEAMKEDQVSKLSQDIGEMWLRLVQGLRKVCLDQREEKDYRNMEGTLILAMKLLSKVFLQLLPDLSQLSTFCKLWLGVLSRMEKYMKVKVRGKRSEKLQETVPELLKNSLLVMKMRGILAQRSALGGDSLWELTWLHVNNISPSLQLEVFPEQDSEHLQHKQAESIGVSVPGEKGSVPSSETASREDAGIVG